MPCAEAFAAQREVVLVVAANSPLHEMDSLEIRKIYLGFTVKRNGKNIRGLLNTSNSTLNDIFLQSVVAMTDKSYRRRLLSMTLRQGIPRPATYDDLIRLQDALLANPYNVTYMWKESADRMTDVRILRVLWRKN